MNTQKLYEDIRDHLLNQGCQAIDFDDNDDLLCMYRAPDDTQCAVGGIIPEGLYDYSFEGTPLDNVVGLYQDRWPNPDHPSHPLRAHWGAEYGFDPDDFDDAQRFMHLLLQFQNIHDEHEPDEWPALLRGFALDHGLRP